MGRRLQRLVGVLGAIAGGVVAVALGTPLVAFGLVQVFGIGAWLLVRYRSWIPETNDWKVNRWNGLLTVVIVSGALAVQNNSIGLTFTEGLSLALLVFGVGYTSYLIGIITTREATGASSENVRKTESAD